MNDCIEYVGAKVDGYGVKRHQGKQVRVHRLAYCEANGIELGAIAGMVVMHRCDNRGCVNPLHLSIGSHADNCADKVAKGRQARGESCGNSKLTIRQVETIRGLIARGHNNAEIGLCYGVSAMCISRIRNNKTWSHT